MQWYHFTLISAAGIAAALAWNVPRAVQWIALGGILYVFSAMWHNYGFPYPTAFGAATNLIMCYLLWIYADQRWELRIWNAYHLMLVVDVLFIFGYIRSQYAFAVSLEIINLIALIFIAGIGIAERVDGIRVGPSRLGWAGSLDRAVWAERSARSRPWWQTAK